MNYAIIKRYLLEIDFVHIGSKTYFQQNYAALPPR